MAENVYALMDSFYLEHTDAELILPKDIVERYFRRKAWGGASDTELRKFWLLLQLINEYVAEQELGSIGGLSVFDYQEILYRYEELQADFRLEKDSVHELLQALDEFMAYWSRNGQSAVDDYRIFLQDVEDSLYVDNIFLMPPRRTDKEFYRGLDSDDGDSEEEVEHLNEILDGVLKGMAKFFEAEKYSQDHERALRIYCGPAYEAPEVTEDEQLNGSDSEFWLGFWDYFMFDYHMLDNDRTPLQYYFSQQREQLSTLEQDILRDLLHARFTVFYIEAVQDDIVICRDLFTDEQIELPVPDFALMDYQHRIFFGHLHTKGILLLNYITSIPATVKLRRRMREVILRQYKLFLLQMPGASIEQFFWREAAAVRHILHIMADFAQLNVVPFRKLPPRLETNPKLRSAFAQEQEMLGVILRHIGFSRYAIQLIVRLLWDALTVWGTEEECRADAPAVLTAVLFMFINLNGYELESSAELYKVFSSNEQDTQAAANILRQRLELTVFDPRYLTEDAFVLSLYYQSEWQ